MSRRTQNILKSATRILTVVIAVLAVTALGYWIWEPGKDFTDGRHNRGRNAIWISHGWLGADEWFVRNAKTNQIDHYRNEKAIRELAAKFRKHGITDIFPHLCPSDIDGTLPATDAVQVEKFLDHFDGFRVMPWVGGPNGAGAQLSNSRWRVRFVAHVRRLLTRHPRLAGIHLNIEPLPSGDGDYLHLLDELRSALPNGKILSIAAYPPPTRWHPFPDVHWDEQYFREVAKRVDQLAVMMYDAGQKIPKTYRKLMSDWAVEVLRWSDNKPVLLGVPTYEDAAVDYHEPHVENITNALSGIHAGLVRGGSPANFQGIAIYCDWETTDAEWEYLRTHFAAKSK